MSLIECPECKKMVSDTTDYCINCGYDLKNYKKIIEVNNHIEEIKQDLRKKLDAELERGKEKIYNQQPREMIYKISEVRGHENDYKKIIALAAFGILGMVYSMLRTSAVGIFFSAILFGIAIKVYKDGKRDFEEISESIRKEQDDFEKYKKEQYEHFRKGMITSYNDQVYAIEETIKENQSVPKNKTPTCPTCGSTKIRPIGDVERGVSVLATGMMSKKINKTFKCENCGYTW